jgi:hypothetical protein
MGSQYKTDPGDMPFLPQEATEWRGSLGRECIKKAGASMLRLFFQTPPSGARHLVVSSLLFIFTHLIADNAAYGSTTNSPDGTATRQHSACRSAHTGTHGSILVTGRHIATGGKTGHRQHDAGHPPGFIEDMHVFLLSCLLGRYG